MRLKRKGLKLLALFLGLSLVGLIVSSVGDSSFLLLSRQCP